MTAAVGEEIYTTVPSSHSHQNFFDIRTQQGGLLQIRADKNNNPQEIDAREHDLRRNGCVYSKARSDYKTERITATQTSALDTQKYDTDTSDDFTSLKQLIVDVDNQDNSEYAIINRELGPHPKPWSEFYETSKLYRFKESFNAFFDNLKFDRVRDEHSEKSITFAKFGKTISIDKLSTGEKQIVFRGAHFLKNSGLLQGGTIFVDEPELSMHPKWQERIGYQS